MFGKLLRRMRALFQSSRLEREMDAELRFHLERQTEENIRRGMGPQEAWRAARRSFGGVIAFTLITTLIVTLFFGRFLANQLFGVTAEDPTTFIGGSFFLMTIAFLDCYLPARKAMLVEPVEALRHE